MNDYVSGGWVGAYDVFVGETGSDFDCDFDECVLDHVFIKNEHIGGSTHNDNDYE